MKIYVLEQDCDSDIAFTTLELLFEYVHKQLKNISKKKYYECGNLIDVKDIRDINTWRKSVEEKGSYYFEVYGTCENGDHYDNWYVVSASTVNEEIDNVYYMADERKYYND